LPELWESLGESARGDAAGNVRASDRDLLSNCRNSSTELFNKYDV